jgi:hypothetical protein
MQVSSALASQTFNKYIIRSILVQKGRTLWEHKYSVHDLYIEAWAIGIWVKQAGIISYKDLAHALKTQVIFKAQQLPVRKVAGGYLVKSFQSERRYFVSYSKSEGWECQCMLYRCWKQRMEIELTQLFQHFNQLFCHHIIAVHDFMSIVPYNFYNPTDIISYTDF